MLFSWNLNKVQILRLQEPKVGVGQEIRQTEEKMQKHPEGTARRRQRQRTELCSYKPMNTEEAWQPYEMDRATHLWGPLPSHPFPLIQTGNFHGVLVARCLTWTLKFRFSGLPNSQEAGGSAPGPRVPREELVLGKTATDQVCDLINQPLSTELAEPGDQKTGSGFEYWLCHTR